MDNFSNEYSNLKLSEIRELERQSELEKKVIEVCEHIINTKDSYRKTAKVFGISVATVSDYCNRYEKLKPQRYLKLKEVISANSEKTINDKEVEMRVLRNARLIIGGKTIEEISIDTGVDYWIVYRDIKKRLKDVDLGLYEEVSNLLQLRKNANLNRGVKK